MNVRFSNGVLTQQSIFNCGIKKITLLDEYSLFKNMKNGLSFRNKYGTFLSDRLNIMFIVHLQFSK